jgi:hypothetical protein
MHIRYGKFRSLTRRAVLLGILELYSAVAFAQNPNSSGIAVLEVIVTDPSGARIPGARIVLNGGKTIIANTGEDGSVRVKIPYGTYAVPTSRPGFEMAKIADLAIQAAKPPDLDVVLQIAHCCDEPPVGEGVGLQPTTSDLPIVIGTVRVPDSATALKIAEPALIKTYGKRQIDDERPLTATLDKGIWTVAGTLWCTDRNGKHTSEQGMCLGGSAVLKLRQRDGKILSIIYYK